MSQKIPATAAATFGVRGFILQHYHIELDFQKPKVLFIIKKQQRQSIDGYTATTLRCQVKKLKTN